MSLTVVAEKTAGGLFLPQTDDLKKRSSTGTVVAVGPGFTTAEGKVLAMNVKVGEEVLLPEYGGVKVEVGGVEQFLYREGDILGTFDKK